MSTKDWVITPDDMTLATMSGWQHLGNNRYRAVRAHILVDKYREDFPKTGPLVHEQVLPAGSEFKIEQKQIIVRKNISTFSSSIHRALSTKVSAEVASKIGNELSFSMKGPAGKSGGEFSTRFGTEFTESLSGDLSSVKSFEIESTEEFVRSLVLKAPEQGAAEQTKYFFYLPLWVWRWDLYLYKLEVVELTYRKNWLWQQIRESVNSTSHDVRVPLAQILFYEPLDAPSVVSGSYTPDVPDAGEVVIRPSLGVCPIANNHDAMTLEAFVPVAFPQTRVEKRESRRAVALVAGTKKSPSTRVIERLETVSQASKGSGKGGGKKDAGKRSATGRVISKSNIKVGAKSDVKRVGSTVLKKGTGSKAGGKRSCKVGTSRTTVVTRGSAAGKTGAGSRGRVGTKGSAKGGGYKK